MNTTTFATTNRTMTTFFNWVTKDCMTETLADEINKAICIIVTLAIIGAVGWLADRLEQKYKNKKEGAKHENNKRRKMDYRH